MSNSSYIEIRSSSLINKIANKSEESIRNEENAITNVILAMAGMFLSSIFISLIVYAVRGRLLRKEISKGPNKMIFSEKDFEQVNILMKTDAFTQGIHSKNFTERIVKIKDKLVALKKLKFSDFQVKDSTLREFKTLREMKHENLNTFFGIIIDSSIPTLVYEYASRGSLEDILLKEHFKLDWNFKWFMLIDLCRAMRFIHSSEIKFHGNLKSRNCIIDSRWILKVTDFGLHKIYSNQNKNQIMNPSDLLWTAPEHLDHSSHLGSQPGDVYSFGIIMQEIIVEGAPYCMMNFTDEEIINNVKNRTKPLCRPKVLKRLAPAGYVQIMRNCWSDKVESRPNFDQIYSIFKSLKGNDKENVVDWMFKTIEDYTKNLENLVKIQTKKLKDEKRKVLKILREIFPKPIVERLISGQPVLPESFDMVTIYFSDIVGFTTISAFSSPFEVVSLLNDLYTMFDETISAFDVYKVETIGDAYMVVSGLPIKNGNKHAGEIATMALNLLHNCGKFQIRHLPGIPLRLRIGLHSGACVTGVVGLKMPRYCLFGDTVNTASRMESTSQAYRIHVSESCSNILEEIGGYKLDYRGLTELPGKGKHKTYWLTGKEGFDKELPKQPFSEKNHGIESHLLEELKRIRREKSNQTESVENINYKLFVNDDDLHDDLNCPSSPINMDMTDRELNGTLQSTVDYSVATVSEKKAKYRKSLFLTANNDSGFSDLSPTPNFCTNNNFF
ncbi:unnamed protein product [Brachionus calyciflorus]|uniref:Guanylate cyclase n=1 Tax=Brachionus calyciflorus TaxID=104777 RepID=A0A813X2H4_9BILA|nr:unnamed protein product [Brachionus calyciflorus]